MQRGKRFNAHLLVQGGTSRSIHLTKPKMDSWQRVQFWHQIYGWGGVCSKGPACSDFFGMGLIGSTLPYYQTTCASMRLAIKRAFQQIADSVILVHVFWPGVTWYLYSEPETCETLPFVEQVVSNIIATSIPTTREGKKIQYIVNAHWAASTVSSSSCKAIPPCQQGCQHWQHR